MRIGITLNEVIRDFIGQLKYVHAKYYGEDYEKIEVVDFLSLHKFFKFNDDKKFNEFLYSEAPMEIFAHADQLHNNLGAILNKFIANIVDEEEHEIVIMSRDVDKSRPSTLFFLSKLGFTGNNIEFFSDTSKMWGNIDMLVTANPIALEAKPENKFSVKISSTYNKDSKSDFKLDSILNFIDDEEKFKEIVNDD